MKNNITTITISTALFVELVANTDRLEIIRHALNSSKSYMLDDIIRIVLDMPEREKEAE